MNDRIKIEIRYRDGWSLREIAEYLGNGRTAGSVCREIGGKPRKGIGKYQAHIAQIRREGNGAVKNGGEDLRKYLVRRHKRRAKKGFRKAQKLDRAGKLPSMANRPKEREWFAKD